MDPFRRSADQFPEHEPQWVYTIELSPILVGSHIHAGHCAVDSLYPFLRDWDVQRVLAQSSQHHRRNHEPAIADYNTNVGRTCDFSIPRLSISQSLADKFHLLATKKLKMQLIASNCTSKLINNPPTPRAQNQRDHAAVATATR